MMDKSQFLLTKLIEECAEVQQRAAKQIQFGKDEIQKGQSYTNSSRLMEEIWHLLSVIELLREEHEINNEINHEENWDFALEQKRARINKYYELSKSLEKVK